ITADCTELTSFVFQPSQIDPYNPRHARPVPEFQTPLKANGCMTDPYLASQSRVEFNDKDHQADYGMRYLATQRIHFRFDDSNAAYNWALAFAQSAQTWLFASPIQRIGQLTYEQVETMLSQSKLHDKKSHTAFDLSGLR